MKSIKKIMSEKNCIGIIFKDKNYHGYYYQPTNDIGFYVEIQDLENDIYYDIGYKIYLRGSKYYVYVVSEDISHWIMSDELTSIENALKEACDSIGVI